MTEASTRRRRRTSWTFNGSVALAARLRKGWTQVDVSRRCGELGTAVDDSNLSRYERGEIKPSPPALAVIAKALELDVTDLITYRDDAA